MLHLRRADTEGQCAKRTVGGGVGVAADDGRARHAQPQFRTDDVDDALTRVEDRNVGNPEFLDVRFQRLDLNAAVLFLDVGGNAGADGRDVMIGDRDRQIGPAQLAPSHAQAFERLRAGDLMHEVAVDIEDAGAVRKALDDVAVPDFVEQGAGSRTGHGLPLWFALIRRVVWPNIADDARRKRSCLTPGRRILGPEGPMASIRPDAPPGMELLWHPRDDPATSSGSIGS